MFTEEGLYITNSGYFLSKYDYLSESYIGTKLSLEQIETHLHTTVILTPETRLKDIFNPILESKVFSVVFQRSFWNGIIQEIKTLPWKDWEYDLNDPSIIKEDTLLYVELYGSVIYNYNDNEFDGNLSSLSFHGVSNTVPYSLSATPITHYMNHPVKIGNFSIYKNQDNSCNSIIDNSKPIINLDALINSIIWDMSFYGLGKDRDDFLNKLSN